MPDGESKEPSDDDIYIIESDIEIDDDAVSKAEAFALKWKAGAKPKQPAFYYKNSRATKWRKSELQARREASVSDCRRITNFLRRYNNLIITKSENWKLLAKTPPHRFFPANRYNFKPGRSENGHSIFFRPVAYRNIDKEST